MPAEYLVAEVPLFLSEHLLEFRLFEIDGIDVQLEEEVVFRERDVP